MSLFYMYCVWVKHRIFDSSLVGRPYDAKYSGSSSRRIYTPEQMKQVGAKKSMQRENVFATAMSKPVRIIGSRELEEIKRIKRQKVGTYKKLHEEYLMLYAKMDDDIHPLFLQQMNTCRLQRLEKQPTALE